MATIARLKVLLEADSQKMQKALGSVKDKIFNIKNAVVGLAGGAGFGAMIKSGLDSADALAKMSSRTGVSVEALSQLRHAADLSDVSMGSLQNALSRMQRSLGMAIDGTKAQKEAFEALNIDIDAFRKLKPAEQFTTLAEQLSRVDDRATMMVLGNDLLGKSFRDLLPMIEGGAAGLQEMAKSAMVVGSEGAAQAARANDSMTKLSNTVRGLGEIFALELAPGIADALEALGSRLPTILAAVSASFKTVGRVIGAVAATVGQILKGNFSAAASIGNISIGEIYKQAVDESMPETAKNTAESNVYLRDIREAVRNPRAATAG